MRFYTVTEESARRRIQAVGSLYAFEESTLSSQVEGRVAEVLADVGDNVQQGQVLVRIDTQELQFEVDRQRGLVIRFARNWELVLTIPRLQTPKNLPRYSGRKQTLSMPIINMLARSKCIETL